MNARSQPPARTTAQRFARGLLWLAMLAALVVAVPALWQSRWLQVPRTTWQLSRMPRPTALPVPVQGVRVHQVADTFGAPRGSDRLHQGLDIFAARGTPVRSATYGLVVSVREGGLGGRQAWVLGPAGERHYYAHLEAWASGLAHGQVVRAGDLLGFVGDSGNARGTPPHLHYGIYGAQGAYDPLPLLRAGAVSARLDHPATAQ